MTIIEIEALSNGAHRNQSGVDTCPEGWAVVPDEFLALWQESGPFVTITAENGVVTFMAAAERPEPEPEPVSETDQRLQDLEDAVVELAAIITGEV